MTRDKEVVIIGGGVIGLCSAYYLHNAGHQVTVLDAGDGSTNCSVGNAGYFCPSHVIPLASPGVITQGLKWMLDSKSPFYIRPRIDLDLLSWVLKFKKASTPAHVKRAAPILHELCTRSTELIQTILNKEGIDAGYKKSGLLMLCKTAETLKHEAQLVQLTKSFGQRGEVLSLQETEKLNPGLDMDIAGAVYFPNDHFFTPQVFMQKFRSLLREKGISILDHHEVCDIQTKDGLIISIQLADGQSVSSDEYVVATGAVTQRFMKPLNINLPIQGGKGYSFDLPSPPAQPITPALLTEGKVAMTPMMNGLRFAGTMEINRLSKDINLNRIEGIKRTVMEFLPQFSERDFSDIQPWAGLRPCSPDGLPYIGRSSKFNNLIVATGHAMLGVTLGPITGKIVSDLVSNRNPELDLTALSIERYG